MDRQSVPSGRAPWRFDDILGPIPTWVILVGSDVKDRRDSGQDKHATHQPPPIHLVIQPAEAAAPVVSGRCASSVVGREQTDSMDADTDLVPFDGAAVVIAGPDGRVAWASPAVETLLRYQAAAIVGSPIDLLVPDEFKARHRAGWRKTWMRRHLAPPESPVMIPVVCGDGEIRRFASHILPLAAPHGELLAVAAVWTAPSAADARVRELT